MKPSLGVRLDTLARQLTPFGLTLFLVVFNVVPLHIPGYDQIAPLLPMIAVYHWALYRSELMPAYAVFIIGLLQDSLTGAPIGINAVVFLIVHRAAQSQRRFLTGKSFAMVWLVFALIAAGAMAAGPERMEGDLLEPGVLVSDLDMERLRYLRSRNFDEENLSKPDDLNWRPLGCRPGQIWERYPALYKELTGPSRYSYDYEYWREGDLDAWIPEYDRIYEGDYERILKKYGAPFQFKEN